MKVLFIGGTGLISTAAARRLVEQGEQVFFYNRGQGELPAGVTHLAGDRRDFQTFETQMVKAGAFDVVIDMCLYEPPEAESVIRAFRGRIRQYIFCSTVDVYTKPSQRLPIHESDACQPAASYPYAFNKARCEERLMAAHDQGDFAVTIIRPAATYGDQGQLVHPLHNWSGNATYFLDRLRKGKPVIVPGDGTTIWVAAHRDDVGPTFAAAAGNPRTFGRAYNVTGEEWLTWNQYHRHLADALGVATLEIIHIPTDILRQVLPRRMWLCVENFQHNALYDNTAACTDLGYRYTLPFAEGACRVTQWLTAHHQIEDCANFPFYDRLIETWQRAGKEMAQALAADDLP